MWLAVFCIDFNALRSVLILQMIFNKLDLPGAKIGQLILGQYRVKGLNNAESLRLLRRDIDFPQVLSLREERFTTPNHYDLPQP